MTVNNEEIRAAYIEGLKEFLYNNRERSLSKAYEKSRELLSEGLSERDLINIHHDALDEFFQGDSVELRHEMIQKASSYFKEWMAPLEVKIQSYRAVIDELHRKNERLKKEINTRQETQRKLAESKDYFKALIENAQDIITVLDRKGIIRYDTPSVNRILGYKKDELVGKNAFRHIHPNDVKKVERAFSKIKDNPGQTVSVEFRFRHKNGSWVYLESLAKFITQKSNGPVAVINSRDITKRKQRMQKLREHRTKLAEAQKIAKVGSWEWNIHADPELEWSDQMCRIYGIDPEDCDKKYNTFIKFTHPEDRERVKKTIESALQNKNSFSLEYKITRADGEVRILHGRGRVMLNEEGNVIKIIGTGQDVTDQKETERKIRDYSERIQRLTERRQRTREKERIRIAREIHDELGQMLTVLKMDISMMSGQMKKKVSGENLEYFNDEAEKILDRINTIMDSVQRITTELRPEVLDDLGLIEALKWQAREFRKRSKLAIDFKTSLTDTDFLDEDETTTLFRIYQETMSNIVRHAQATEIKIKLEKRKENLLLSVSDNGVGITEAQQQASNSFGLMGMRERARFLGGDVYIEGKKGEGTNVLLRIPLNENEKAKLREEL